MALRKATARSHAVVHVYEMRGQVDTGIGFLHQQEPHWTVDNLFTVHNWWHLALFLLEAGRPDGALAIYDAQIHHAGSAGVPLEMLDASALLLPKTTTAKTTPAISAQLTNGT